MAEPPDPFPTFSFKGIDEFISDIQKNDREVSAGIAIVGDAADYGLVWEWGNRRQKKQGPRTVLGTNPKGKRVWLSSQAPSGYIRINTPIFDTVINSIMSEVNFSSKSVTKELEKAAKKISKALAQIVKEAAPVDSGLLRRSIVPVDPGDASLDKSTTAYTTLDLT